MTFTTQILPRLLSLFFFQYALALEAQPEQDFSRSVVQIRLPNSDDRGSGVGFIVKIDPNKIYIITPQHVIEGANSPVNVIFSGQSQHPVKAEINIIAMPNNPTAIVPVRLDLAVLEIDKKSITEEPLRDSLSPLCLSDKSKFSSEVKKIISFSNNGSKNGISDSTGNIDSAQTTSLEIVFYSTSLAPGQSGSILMEGKQVIGMFIGKDGNRNIALPAELIWRYLNDKAGLPVEACLSCNHALRSTTKPRGHYFTKNEISTQVNNIKEQFATITDHSLDRYQKRNNSTIIDKSSCLMWEYLDKSSPKTYEEGNRYLAELRKSTHDNDWRLPTVEELSSLLTTTSTKLHINDIFVSNHNTIWNYWSSDEESSSRVWVINFSGNPSFVVAIEKQRDEKDIGIMAVRSMK